MGSSSLVAWAVPRLAQLLPLDEESLEQVVSYAAGLSREASADHLKNLLGDSPAALEFIISFNSRRHVQHPLRNAEPTPGSSLEIKAEPKRSKKIKTPLRNARPLRKPDNYGDTTGRYMKDGTEEEYMRPIPDPRKELPLLGKPGSGQPSHAASPDGTSIASLYTQYPATRQKPARAPPSASGPVVSDLLPNVKSRAARPARQGGSRVVGTAKESLTTNNISDLTAAIAALEVSTNPALDKGRRKCTCYATIHPLFDPAPNCLSCGKIVCALEGLQPCSFCGTPLLSNDEVQSMIRELRAERGHEKMKAHNEGVQRDGSPSAGASNQLSEAKAHRDKLLQFQAQNTRRTRVMDEAADFETPSSTSTLWMSPAQRALALKRQQRVLREMDEKMRPEWEKKRTIMSLDIKGRQVTRVYQSASFEEPSRSPEDVDTEEQPMANEGMGSGQALSGNPLLAAGGLMRPVWKKPEDRAAPGRKDRKQMWRRVQNDGDDNEQWILDGGLHSYAT